MTRVPLLLRFPPWLADEQFNLRLLLSRDPERSWANAYSLLEVFDVSGPERAFCRELLQRKRNLWLFRCNQRQLCGDLAVVDMSPPEPAARSVAVIELKAGAELRIGGGGASNQLQNAADVLHELQELSVVAHGAGMDLVSGSNEAVLTWVDALGPR